jgi:anti-sigma factor RsiW
MSCREFRHLLVYLAFGDLPADQQGRIDEHLRQCAACAAEWRDYQQVVRLARQLPPTPLPAGVEDRFQILVDTLKETRRGSRA